MREYCVSLRVVHGCHGGRKNVKFATVCALTPSGHDSVRGARGGGARHARRRAGIPRVTTSRLQMHAVLCASSSFSSFA